MLDQPKLIRAVGLFGLTAIAVNGVVGAGIFVMPATVANLLGTQSISAYLLAGAAAALIALAFAEAGSYFEKAGGPYVYARAAFGPFIAFEVGWMFVFGRLTGAAAVVNAFAAYVGVVHPAIAITVSIAAIGALNYAGVKYGSTVVNVLTVGKLVPLFVFIGIGFTAIDPRILLPSSAAPFQSLREASLILLFALGGFEFASVPSEEVINSRRNLPIALIAGIVISAGVYILVQAVCLGVLPGVGQSSTPVSDAAAKIVGPAGAALITIGAILSTTGTNSTILLIGPRMLYALAQGGQLPAFLGRVHPRFHTPHIAVALFACTTLVIALTGTFAQLAALNAIARLLYSVTTCAAVPVLRRRMPPGQRRFALPFGAFVPAMGVVACLFLLTGINPSQALLGFAGLASGAVVYLIQAAQKKGTASPSPL